jgi:alanine racemase
MELMSPYRSWVEISRSRVAGNFHAIRTLVGPQVEVMPVVKADAYRHGAVEVSRVLTAEGASWLAVGNVEEGVALRQAGITAHILVMADFLPVERSALIEYELTPVIHSLEDLAEWDHLADTSNASLRYHLKIDTGMGRLGTQAPARTVVEAIQAARHATLEGIMTHFASAGDYSSGQTERQTGAFRAVSVRLEQAGIRPRYVHMSSTIPLGYGRRETWANMVRPGHAIYGYVSPARGDAPPRILDVKPALTWKATILAVKDVPEGASIGYGAMHIAAHPTRIAVLAVGYADGLPHRLSNRGRVIAGEKYAPILGAVSMDLTTIDISQSPQLRPGDSVTIIGSEGDCEIDAQQLARLAGTISYSVLCGITSRVKRVYL